MNEQEMKSKLCQLAKSELVEIFSSLNLKATENKELLVNAILEGEPAEEELQDCKNRLKKKAAAKLKPPSFYIVRYAIKEDGGFYAPGSEYTGKNIERFLKDGQIRKK